MAGPHLTFLTPPPPPPAPPHCCWSSMEPNPQPPPPPLPKCSCIAMPQQHNDWIGAAGDVPSQSQISGGIPKSKGVALGGSNGLAQGQAKVLAKP